MATLVLAAAGAAVGASFGAGTILGMTGSVIGRAVGATLGQVIDQRLLASGSEPVQTGRIDRFRMMGASEGAPIPRVWGRVRLGGQVIWASRFEEVVSRQGGRGGKGTPRRPVVEEFSYTVSLAVALCEGPILRVGRVWADGVEIDPDRYTMHVYRGDETQMPDPKIAAVEGIENAPAYRGTAYVVFEDLPLAEFGNRVPQFSFEVVRGARNAWSPGGITLGSLLSAVALIPGTGEYALATDVVRFPLGPGQARFVNRHTASRRSDFEMSLKAMRGEMPGLGSVSLVVSWFGNDLRCGSCSLRPKVEQKETDAPDMPWRAGGMSRAEADVLATVDGRSVYGGTPADRSVIQAIQALRAGGQQVMFYPFVLMEQLVGNGLPDPWTGAADQPVLPWRGRITLSDAPGRPNSVDRTEAAEAQVSAFFGSATAAQIVAQGGDVVHQGAMDWGYRRFILHYARLCQLAGGVDAFCIGSELRGLTQIRGAGDSFPTVQALRALAADVRSILGPGTRISYAADWSEYWGYAADGNRYFHLDPLWADPNIDFIGIDNYMPISDWRDGEGHRDIAARSVYDLGYLRANIGGGEGYDWYYDSAEGEAAQNRLPIRDDAHGEDWIWRNKDIRSWWTHPHHDRIDGQRLTTATEWVPQSKPIWFTEFGCAAVDKATNQPNLFLDPKSSESILPRGSNGQRDDLIQLQYVRAVLEYWTDPANNPVSTVYAGPMVDVSKAHLWAWDARPFPTFPGLSDVWSDGENYDKGHWINGRSSSVPLADLVQDVLTEAGITDADTSALYGVVRGYLDQGAETPRAALQPLMMAHGFDCHERGGRLRFVSRSALPTAWIDPEQVVASADGGDIALSRAGDAELPREMRITHIEAEADYQVQVASMALPGGAPAPHSKDGDLPLVLTAAEAQQTAERLLFAAHSARETVRLSLPRSSLRLGVGDVFQLKDHRYRIDRMDLGDVQEIEAVRVEAGTVQPARASTARALLHQPVSLPDVFPVFLDLPLLTGQEVPHAPHVAVAADPWPGRVAVWMAPGQEDFALNSVIADPSVIGQTETALSATRPGVIERTTRLRLRLGRGELESVTREALLNGANLAAIGDGSPGNWEVMQFAHAELIAPTVWELTGFLRGQAGTDALMPAVWPAGSLFVLIGTGLQQIALRESEIGLPRTWRVGPGTLGYADPDMVERVMTFSGVGRRPYRVAHLQSRDLAGDHLFQWVRRTRIDGDGWRIADVPLGETAEHYLLRILHNSQIIRDVWTTSPSFTYGAAARLADGVTGPYEVQVAQVSETWGPGPFRKLVVGA